MIVAAEYSFNHGAAIIARRWRTELEEIYKIISKVDAVRCRTKVSREKTMPGKLLNDPKALNREFKSEFFRLNWSNQRVKCLYSNEFYRPGYRKKAGVKSAFREMDFLKNKLGVEVQFGKYAFMVYNVCAKMTIFHKLGHINAGVEVVPMKSFADQMSTGISYFEQFVWDLEHRGVADIDIPVLILGIAA